MQSAKDIYINFIEENINTLDKDKKLKLLLYLYNNYDKKYFVNAKTVGKLYVNRELFKSLEITELKEIYNLIQNK
mgnify:CR=1 FL=1